MFLKTKLKKKLSFVVKNKFINYLFIGFPMFLLSLVTNQVYQFYFFCLYISLQQNFTPLSLAKLNLHPQKRLQHCMGRCITLNESQPKQLGNLLIKNCVIDTMLGTGLSYRMIYDFFRLNTSVCGQNVCDFEVCRFDQIR